MINCRYLGFIILSITAIGLSITSVSTTYWVQKDVKTTMGVKYVDHYGLFKNCQDYVGKYSGFNKCHSVKMIGDGMDWNLKVKAVSILSIIIGIIALVFIIAKIFTKKTKAFIAPVLMFISCILMFSAVGTYDKYHRYVYIENPDIEITDLTYGWSFIVMCIGGVIGIFSVLLGVYADYFSVFGKSNEQFQRRKLEESA